MDMIYHCDGKIHVAPLPDNYDLPETRHIHALVWHRVGRRKVTHRFTVEIPYDTDRHESVRALASAAAQILEAAGSSFGYVRHHRRHSLQPLQIRHWLHGLWHNFACFLKPFSGNIVAVQVGA